MHRFWAEPCSACHASPPLFPDRLPAVLCRATAVYNIVLANKHRPVYIANEFRMNSGVIGFERFGVTKIIGNDNMQRDSLIIDQPGFFPIMDVAAQDLLKALPACCKADPHFYVLLLLHELALLFFA